MAKDVLSADELNERLGNKGLMDELLRTTNN